MRKGRQQRATNKQIKKFPVGWPGGWPGAEDQVAGHETGPIVVVVPVPTGPARNPQRIRIIFARPATRECAL